MIDVGLGLVAPLSDPVGLWDSEDTYFMFQVISTSDTMAFGISKCGPKSVRYERDIP